MMNLFLDAVPMTNAGNDLSVYTPYVQGVAYVIVAILAVVGAIYVAQAYQSGDSQARQKAIRLVGACVFFSVAITGIPKFFGVDSSGEIAAAGGGSGSGGSVFDDLARGFDDRFKLVDHGKELKSEPLYVIDLPNGGTAVIRPPRKLYNNKLS